MNSRVWRIVSRAIAIAIAIVAAIDPAVTTNRPTKPIVSVVAVHSRDLALGDRVASRLEKHFTVVRAPLATANASVVVGDNLPARATELAGPVFAVLGDRSGPTVTLDRVEAPSSSPSVARVPVTTVAHVTGARGRMLDVSLRSDGLVFDHATRVVRSDDERMAVALTFVPTAAGATHLRVSASIGDADTAAADLGVDVRDTRWAVLFFDPRPSWMSTFARRAIESDPRFVVTSRVVTSRNVSTDAGQPPGRLDDLAALALFDAVVIGAPEALSDQDVAGLEAFLRRRGGSAVLLLDRRAPGPYERLMRATAWATDNSGKAETIGTPGDSMRAAELAWPAPLPDGADVVASTRGGSPHPVVWSTHIGAGQLIVSGALDAWRFRDRSVSTFDRFWQTIVANAADAAPQPITVAAAQTIAAPGARIDLSAQLRDASLSTARPLRAGATATLVSDARATNVRLWPGDRVGTFRGEVRAPTTPGVYRLAVAANGARGEVPIVVAANVARPSPEAPELLRAWVASRGGATVTAADIGSLEPRLVSAIQPADRRVTWHPMRSAWWIIPFVLALSAEWWLRRRRGLR